MALKLHEVTLESTFIIAVEDDDDPDDVAQELLSSDIDLADEVIRLGSCRARPVKVLLDEYKGTLPYSLVDDDDPRRDMTCEQIFALKE